MWFFPVDGTIIITFDEPISIESEASIMITYFGLGHTPIPNVIIKSVSGNQLILDLTTDLAYDNIYVVQIVGGAVKDSNGNLFGGDHSYSLRTIKFTLQYSAVANGTISGDKNQEVGYGHDGTEVIAVPNTGYHFTSWSDGITTASRTDSNVSNNIDVTESFEIN